MVELLDQAEVRGLLASMTPPISESGGPGVLIAGLEPPAIVWANQPAEAAIGTADRTKMNRLLFGAPSQRAMVERLKRVHPGLPDQLERLSVVSGFHVERLTLLSRSFDHPDLGRLAILQVIGGANALSPVSPVASPLQTEGADRSPPDSAPAETNLAPPASASEPEIAGPRSVEAVTTQFAARRAVGRQPRFVWEIDPSGVITTIGSELAGAVGDAAPKPGDNIVQRLHDLDPEAADTVRAALANRQSWAGLTVPWPVDDSDAAVAVTFGAAPLPSRPGFRGFGLIHLDQVSARSKPLPETAGDPAPAEIEDEPLPTPAETPAAAETATMNLEPASPEPEPEAPPVETVASRQDVQVLPDIAPARRDEGNQEFPPASSKVVHLMRFKSPAQASGPMSLPRPDLKPVRIPVEEPPAGSEPRWAESPGDETPVQLSSVEQSAFQEIARTLTGVDATPSPEAVADEGPESLAMPEATPAAEPLRIVAPPRSLSSDAATLLDRLPIGILVVQNERPVYANRMLLDLLGYPDVGRFVDSGDLSTVFGNRAKGPAALGGHSQSVTLVSRDGGEIAVDGRVQGFEWHGEPATLMSFRRALDDEAAARIEAIRLDLQRSQGTAQDLADALEMAASGAGVLDAAGRILAINPAAERYFGYDQREVAGDPATLVLAPEQDHAWAEFMTAVLAAGDNGSASRPFSGRKRDGEAVPLTIMLRQLGDNRMSVVWHEAPQVQADQALDTARREAERASSLKSEFLAKVSHEIRTPLNAIIGFAEIMMEERFGPIENNRYREYMKDIHASGVHVMSLVNDLLDLSRIEAGRLDLKLIAVNANEIISQCVATLQGQAHRERIILRLSLAPRLPAVLADERALRQIILNLLSNAVKFNEPGGQVIVSTTLTEGGAVAIRIRDTGLGMSEKDIEIAMEPFRQLETPKASAGSGLGLPLTKALVEASDASMVIRSRPGEGTLVEVTFQAAPAEALSVPAE